MSTPTHGGPIPSQHSPGHQPGQSPNPAGHSRLRLQKVSRYLRDPLALLLITVIVVAGTLAGLIGGELIGRHIANGRVTQATECVVQDKVKASFEPTPPFLWQHIRGRYTNIVVQTAGNRIKEAQQMQADLRITDVLLHTTDQSKGTIGSLDVTLTWPTAGIKKTISELVPVLGNLVSDVVTSTADGTVSLRGAFGLATVVVKPHITNGGLALQVQSISGLGALTFPRESVQPALDEFASLLTRKYPLNLRAENIQVTDSGIVARFATHNASIPLEIQDPCFAGL